MNRSRSSTSFVRTLYFRVLVGIVAGVVVGFLFPHFGASLKPLGDGFLKLIRMLVAPIVFFTVVTGIAKVGDLRRLGRVGLKSLLYFETVTTFALVLGMVVAKVIQPGRGINANPATLDTRALAQYTTGAVHMGTTDFLLNIIPESFIGAFARGEILQVLLLAVLSGIALAMMREERLVALSDSLSHFFFKLVAVVMEAAPVGVFGAMAFTVGRYGWVTLLSLGKLMLCFYITSVGFIAIVLGAICWASGISLWRFVVYIREELLIVIGTSSSEPALPRLMLKLEHLGCSKSNYGACCAGGILFQSGWDFDLFDDRAFVCCAGYEHSALAAGGDFYSFCFDVEFEGCGDCYGRRAYHADGNAGCAGYGSGRGGCVAAGSRPVYV